MATPIKPSLIDTNNDGKITQKEWYDFVINRPDLQGKEDLELLLGNTPIKGDFADIQAKLSGLPGWGSNVPVADKQLEQVKKDMDDLLRHIKEAKLQRNEQRLQELQQMLKGRVAHAKWLNTWASKGKALDLTPYQLDGNFKASVTSSNRTPYSGNLPGGSKAQSAGGSTSFYPPAGWGKAQTATPTFNSSAYLQSMAVEDNIMSAWDSINQNTSRGKQLMMLFFYFARMAASGDMGAMYQFMKFITYIISKDKAKQQIEMGKKLIQLQELSRKWTSKLLDVQSNSADPAASNELMKTMTIVKSETDAIATSQKLISQMMEEFAQVVESLTNSTKAALDAHGRILRTVSRVG